MFIMTSTEESRPTQRTLSPEQQHLNYVGYVMKEELEAAMDAEVVGDNEKTRGHYDKADELGAVATSQFISDTEQIILDAQAAKQYLDSIKRTSEGLAEREAMVLAAKTALTERYAEFGATRADFVSIELEDGSIVVF